MRKRRRRKLRSQSLRCLHRALIRVSDDRHEDGLRGQGFESPRKVGLISSRRATRVVDKQLKILSFGLTDVGMRRDHNEDSYLVDDDTLLYVVADGMGGHL